ncbi:zinc transporter ZupT [Aureispira anguillae]|uniref:Zinc transporter ZupT n=1 Tax=Aureispira anguillae TaxID=2864201 RepID=A0A916DTK4_9BACT|nr:zinc transporter ZupT [Aureispira anguillae]BDS13314.1 zinc transporter ZupT [Aureispira anguillae]
MEENVQIAFILTIIAGLSTGIGSLIAFFIKEKSVKFLSFSMGLAAGVMLYLSFMEMLPHAVHSISATLEHAHDGTWFAIIAFFGGMLLVGMIDRLTPHHHGALDSDTVLDKDVNSRDNKKLMRVGVMTAIALAIHNFPEGIATFVSALEDPHLGLTIAIAIALHNIPEGIGVSMPIYYATGSRKKAFMYSFLSGLVEPLGAILGYFLFMSYLTPFVMGMLIASVAGIMVFISLDQLLPAAHEYDDHRNSIYGVVLGMFAMAISLALLVGHHAHTHVH